MRNTGPSPAVRSAVYERAGFRCERCYSSEGPFAIHHRRPRAMGGSRRDDTNSLDNLVLLDDACHREVESNREQAYADGWLLRQHQRPEDVPLRRGCVLIDDACTDDAPCVSCPWRAA